MVKITTSKTHFIEYLCIDCERSRKEQVGTSILIHQPDSKAIERIRCLSCGSRVCPKCNRGVLKARVCKTCFSSLYLTSQNSVRRYKKIERIRNVALLILVGPPVLLGVILFLLGIAMMAIPSMFSGFLNIDPFDSSILSPAISTIWQGVILLIVAGVIYGITWIPSNIIDGVLVSNINKQLEIR